MSVFKFSAVDFLFTCVGLLSLLFDIVLDIYTAVDFFKQKSYVALGILILLLVGSSVLVQAFSWLWYSYEDFKRETKVENCLSKSQLRLLHLFQLGIYFRHAGVMEVSVGSLSTGVKGDVAVYLSHDLGMLRLIEAFAESSPQLVLMLTIILQRWELTALTVLKAVGSAAAIVFSVTTYHRSLRSFLPDKKQQKVLSSVVFFFWNLLIIFSRFVALSLFASVLPCYIFTHFFCSWLIFFFCVWRSKTSFMDSPGGEWLYRATVGLIWYFTWFNVAEGRTMYRTLLYHGFILMDISLLCGLWCWRMSTEEVDFQIPFLYSTITAVCVVATYLLGLFFKIIYYKYYHPNVAKEELKGGPTSVAQIFCQQHTVDELDGPSMARGFMSSPAPEVKPNKRLRKLAENFYS
ncbi:XK-related protein 8-like [Echeneis naucrates]|uniref:XK-related protein n=1 Tax=Echeneis naucrates TaxID=173247 RepID=A0A665VYY0_ECHNA|nr:XK-related protein 8-like [Echeneis naucrates]